MDILAKTERIFVSWLDHVLAGGVTVRAARLGGETSAPPFLLVHAATAANSDLPPAAGTYRLDLVFSLDVVADSGGTPGRAVDALGELQCALLDLSGAKAFCNAPSSGTDTRVVGAFHLHDIEITSHAVTTDDRRIRHDITARVTVTNADQ